MGYVVGGALSTGLVAKTQVRFGRKVSFQLGLLVALLSAPLGLLLGMCAGYFGGWIDEMLTRITELFQTIPHITFILAVVTVLGPRIAVVVLAIGLTNWTSVARVARAEFLSWRERDFVLADHAIGMGNLRIIVREILPNALPPIIVLVSFTVASSILLEAALARFPGEGLEVIARSSWWKSAAWPDPHDPPFLNGVVRIRTALDPHALMAALGRIERAFGRTPSARNAPRTLDLDLVAFGRLAGDLDGLILPHPRAAERLFVMGPLAEIAPD
eukprot:gene55551-74169_t